MHFTYVTRTLSDPLSQGDIISKENEFAEVVRKVHPHYYYTSDYKYFIVLTQSCDLVKRPEHGSRLCQARYVTVGAVRPLETALAREIREVQAELESELSIAPTRRRTQVDRFLRKLLNNNEEGYFYLHSEPSFGFAEPMCAFLRLSIALRAAEHYQKVCNARVGGLNDVFQAKLGWLIGNMYSRVGTPDWSPAVETSADQEARVKQLLDDSVYWVGDDVIKEVKRRVSSGELTLDEAKQPGTLKSLSGPSRKS